MINESVLTDSGICNNASTAIDYGSLPRFRWYGYKEGFSPLLVEKAIESVGVGPDDYILDPFNGGGAVTLTASLKNVKSIGIEVNPFSAFMSQVKLENYSAQEFSKVIDSILGVAYKGGYSALSKHSTFSERTGKKKWLFNSAVLDSFEGVWAYTDNLPERNLIRLSLIGAAMDNCNAAKDGKCLKYRPNWRERNFSKESFIHSLENRLKIIATDLNNSPILNQATIINQDSRNAIDFLSQKFKLCITSPPYLNSFDYTDIYRPELFLGKFINSNEELRKLRYRTLRSHVEINLPRPTRDSFGNEYKVVYEKINSLGRIWDNQIPVMIQAYFEDMQIVLKKLLLKAGDRAELRIVVANSAYGGIEIPVDLILANIATNEGWCLKRIEVLRHIYRRKTKHSGDIKKLRESLIILSNNS